MQWVDPPQRDGFQLTRKVFVSRQPDVTRSRCKAEDDGCNLFANYQQSIIDIVRLLDEKYENVVSILLEQRLIQQRRKEPRESGPHNR